MTRTHDLLQDLLSGGDLTSNDLDELLNDEVKEDLHLEYKQGKELDKKGEAQQTIRKYVSGFANSDGGILLVGVDEDNWCVTGCKVPGGGDVAQWASDCLQSIPQLFSPPPRFSTLDHKDGLVLVIATSRNPYSLIPVVEGDKVFHYFRLHDKNVSEKTINAPEYLVRDLVLGRRNQPDLRVINIAFNNTHSQTHRTREMDICFRPVFSIENQSFTWAENVKAGIVVLAKHVESRHGSSPFVDLLRSYVDIHPIDTNVYSGNVNEVHSRDDLQDIDSFSVKDFLAISGVEIPVRNNLGI